MIAAAFVLMAISAPAPPASDPLAWIGVAYRPAKGEPSPDRPEVSFEPPAGVTVDEVALLEPPSEGDPRWRLLGSRPAPRASFRALPGRSVVAFLRAKGETAYWMDGPFVWPAAPARREPSPVKRRTIGGVAVGAAAGSSIRVLPDPGGAICRIDTLGVWTCVGVPADARGVVVGSRESRGEPGRLFWADVPASIGAARLETHSASWAAFVRLVAEPPPAGAPTLTIQKPGSRDGRMFYPDTGFESRVFPGGRVLVFGADSAEGRRATFRWETLSGHAEIDSLTSSWRSGEPSPVPLRDRIIVRGVVRSPDGDPIAGALYLLLESGDPKRPGGKTPDRAVATGEADAAGRFEIADVAPGSYRLRACDGSIGCAERDVDLDSPANDVTLTPKTAFRGRAVSRGGVPEGGAWVRISPAISDYVQSADRLRLLPLVARADGEGRFRIAAPASGRFVLEVRSERGGAARRNVEVGDFSPAATDLGDLVLSVPGTFDALVKGCPGGELRLLGPIGGESALPSNLPFPLDAGGRARVQLPEDGTWIVAATCGGTRREVEPPVLNEVRDLFGTEVVFSLVADAPR